MGIEPTYSAWEADVLPLNYTRTISNYIFLLTLFQVQMPFEIDVDLFHLYN